MFTTRDNLKKAASLVLVLGAGFSIAYAATWVGPTEPPPEGNTPPPINVGTVDQVKEAGLGVDALSVFGNSYIDGTLGVGDTSPDADLTVDVEGKVGASAYCDEDGNNCTLAQELAGGASGPQPSANLNCRVCLKGGAGSTCSPWTSQGGGWSQQTKDQPFTGVFQPRTTYAVKWECRPWLSGSDVIIVSDNPKIVSAGTVDEAISVGFVKLSKPGFVALHAADGSIISSTPIDPEQGNFPPSTLVAVSELLPAGENGLVSASPIPTRRENLYTVTSYVAVLYHDNGNGRFDVFSSQIPYPFDLSVSEPLAQDSNGNFVYQFFKIE